MNFIYIYFLPFISYRLKRHLEILLLLILFSSWTCNHWIGLQQFSIQIFSLLFFSILRTFYSKCPALFISYIVVLLFLSIVIKKTSFFNRCSINVILFLIGFLSFYFLIYFVGNFTRVNGIGIVLYCIELY